MSHVALGYQNLKLGPVGPTGTTCRLKTKKAQNSIVLVCFCHYGILGDNAELFSFACFC